MANTPGPKHLVKASRVKAIAAKYGKRVSEVFLTRLDERVEKFIVDACLTTNGGGKTLDEGLADYVLGRRNAS